MWPGSHLLFRHLSYTKVPQGKWEKEQGRESGDGRWGERRRETGGRSGERGKMSGETGESVEWIGEREEAREQRGAGREGEEEGEGRGGREEGGGKRGEVERGEGRGEKGKGETGGPPETLTGAKIRESRPPG
jgi:hypothetical protein